MKPIFIPSTTTLFISLALILVACAAPPAPTQQPTSAPPEPTQTPVVIVVGRSEKIEQQVTYTFDCP